ncbi:MAG: DMT family transporter, partial [Cyanobacteria bacterium P01_C01_bin.73]
IGLTLTGVGWVISERVPQVTGTGELPSFQSIGLGLLAAMGQATGAVLSRAALADTAVDPLWSTLLRLVAGVGTLLVLLLTVKQKQLLFKPLGSLRLLSAVAIAAFFGTYLAIWLQQTALKYAPTGVAQTLTATSPIFVLPIAALMGDRVSSRAVLGVGVAIVGIGLLFS